MVQFEYCIECGMVRVRLLTNSHKPCGICGYPKFRKLTLRSFQSGRRKNGKDKAVH